MNPALRGHRVESFWWELLDRDTEAPMGLLDGVKVGTVNYSVHATYRASGSLTWAGTDLPDWKQYRIRPWYRAVLEDGSVESWPLGTFVATSPGEEYDATAASVEVDLYDKLMLLDQAKLTESWSIAPGAQITQWIDYWIRNTPGIGTGVLVEPSAETMRAPVVWEAGTPHLRVVNDLCDMVNYFSAWADGYGVVRAEPYVAPLNRSVAWDFRHGRDCTYLPTFQRQRDTADVPNRLTLVTTSDGETEPLVATVTDEDPDSETSFPARGYWVDETRIGVEAASQAVLDELAVRGMLTARQKATTFSIQHPLLPMVGNELVTFRHDPSGIDAKAVVQTIRVPVGAAGGLCSTELRQVTT